MYKLMVVDDERIAIESVEFIVKKEISNVKVVSTAASGRIAIEKAREQRPDIVLMDIQMPGINGLEAVREIKKIHNNVKFVIVSAFEYFEFAQKAVELGVTEYLTKPLNKNVLIETLLKLTKELDTEKDKFDEEMRTREKLRKMQIVVEHSCIYSLLLAQNQKSKIKRYKEIFEIKQSLGYIYILKINRGDAEDASIDDSVINQKFYSYFKDMIKRKTTCIVGPVMLDRVVVYTALDKGDKYQQRVEIIDYLEHVIRRLAEKFANAYKIGIGSIKEDEDIYVSYLEANRALNYNPDENVTHIEDVACLQKNTNMDIYTDEKSLIEFVEKGDTKSSLSLLMEIFNRYPEFYQNENIRNRLVEFMVVAHRKAIENGVENDSYLEYSNYINQILECDTSAKFKDMCLRKIRYICDKINKMKKTKISSIVDKANRIINERYNKELTLDDISKELCISPQYFSRLYKDEMGVNFIEQLTKKRIESAKKLIDKGEHSIKEICYLSGYSDPNYFSRLFKKHTGLSPSAYQKKVQ